jgi:hypothetical protein
MTNVVFVTIAVKAPSGISQKKLTEVVVESLARARGIQDELLPDTTKLEFAPAGRPGKVSEGPKPMSRIGEWR